MLTKKDFQKFAAKIKESADCNLRDENGVLVAFHLYTLVCDVNDNPNFNKPKFAKACGIVNKD